MRSTDPPVVLSVAGTDSGGAAGLFADIATFAALDTHGAGVVSAVTAQDTTGVHDVHPIPLTTVAAQVDAVLADLPVAAVKTGMLGSPEVVGWLSERLSTLSTARPALVVDPVLVATSGAVLGDEEVRDALLEHLLPVATVVTPNLDEARALAGSDGPPDELAAMLTAYGCAVVVTGGPDGSAASDTCTDWIAVPEDWGELPADGAGRVPRTITHPAIRTDNDHGTGCTYSAALAARLARGDDLLTAAEHAAAYTTGQLRTSRTWTLGRGRGPIAHVGPIATTGVSNGSTHANPGSTNHEGDSA